MKFEEGTEHCPRCGRPVAEPGDVVVARVAAAEALHQIGGEAAHRALQQALHSERPSLRDAARRVLQRNLEELERRNTNGNDYPGDKYRFI